MSLFSLSIKNNLKRFIKSINTAVYIHALSVVVGLILVFFGIWQLLVFNNSPDISSLATEGSNPSNNDYQLSQIIVEVTGAVKIPGIYQLQYGDRVAHAVNMSGGIDEEKVDLELLMTQINFAQLVHDGDKIIIPLKGNINYSGTTNQLKQTENSLISINNSSLSELMGLSGIGEVRASKIIDQRPYFSINSLVEKKIISESLMKELKSQLAL